MSRTPFAIEDLLRFELIRDVQVHPGGTEVLYETKVIDEDADAYRSSISVVPVTGGEPIELVPATALNTTPRWSPDGSQIAFLSDRGGGPKALHVMRRDGGEARRVKAFARGIQSICWSPDGASILVSVTIDHVAPGGAAGAGRPKRVHRQRYKSDGAGFLLDASSQLRLIRLGDGHVTELGELLSPCFSPDGRRIACVRYRGGPRDGHLSDLWMMSTDGTGARQLTTEIPSVASPAWSPDGRWIAFVGDRLPGNSLASLWLVDARTGELRQPGGDEGDATSFPLVPAPPPSWTPDSRRVRYLASRRGLSEIASLDVEAGERTAVGATDAQVVTFHAAGETIAYVVVGAGEPGDVHVRRGDGAAEQLTRTNRWWWTSTADHSRSPSSASRTTCTGTRCAPRAGRCSR